MDYDDLLNMLGPKPGIKRASKPRLPREVQTKIADKIQWSKELGICIHCGDILIANQDRILRTKEIKVFGGMYSENCHLSKTGHELDPRHTYGAGRRYLNPRRDNDATEPPF